MTIINTQISSGGGQGGGDKVIALVGSNASGIDVGDKVILNYPAVNEKGYCSEYRFNSLSGVSAAQWTIFFGEYMMYVDTSGHPVFFKHDTVNDKLIYITRLSGITLPSLGMGLSSSFNSDGSGATRITYNETTKRFAVCKDGTLTIYQAEVDDSSANVYPIWSASTLTANGGIAQDSDTFWYMTTDSDLNSIVVKDFTYSGGTFVEGSAYTHTNTCPSFYPSGVTGQRVGFSPNLKWFALSYGNATSATLDFCGMVVDKENKQVTYGSSAYTVTMNNYLPRSSVFSLNNSGNGVIIQIYSNYLRTAYFTVSQAGTIENVVVQNQIYNSYFANISYAFQGYGIIHQTGDWVTGPVYPLNITSSGFSKVDYIPREGYALNNIMIASLSSTGLFTWPCPVASGTNTAYSDILVRWNNGAPTVGDTYIEPASTIQYPFYFDGNFLYATGGIYATNGGTSLTKVGNLTYGARWRCPPMFLNDGSVGFGYGSGGCNYIYLKNGVCTGSFPNTNLNIYAVDMRLNSSRTGWAATCATTSNVSGQGIDYIENGSRKSYRSSSPAGGFLDKDGNAYMYYASTNTSSPFHIYSCTYDGSGSGASGINTTEIFTSAGLWNFIGGSYQYAAAVCAKDDNIHFWYVCNSRIIGFTELDLTNNAINPLTTPSALQVVKGIPYAAWWDLQNRLTIRTDVGLYVFAYTNHDISTMQLVKKFEWDSAYAGPATCSSDLMSYAVGNDTYVKVVRETVMPVYEFSANVYNGQNFAGTSLTGFVNEAISTDPWGQSIVEVNTVKDPADTWTNVGTPFGFDVSTTSSDISVGWGYYNSGSAEVIIPSTVTKTLSQASSGQTTGFKNDVVVYHDASDNNSALICKTGTTPVGTFKASTALSTNVYLNDDKTAVAGTSADSGFGVTYEVEHSEEPDYTIVGSVTVSDKVASGFSSSNYISIPQSAAGIGYTFYTKITTSSVSSSSKQTFVGKYPYETLFIKSSKFQTWSWGSNSEVEIANASANTTYWIKATYGVGTRTYYFSTDGINYDSGHTVNDSSEAVGTDTYSLGTNGSSEVFGGSIYLADTYVKNGDSFVWKAYSDPTDGSVTVSDGYHYNNETDAPFYLGSDLTRSASQMVVHSEDFVETTIPMTDYSVTGSPTINGSIVSDCDGDDYVYGASINSSNSSSNPIEAVMKFKQSTARTAKAALYTFGGVYIGISASNVFLTSATNGSSWSSEVTGSAVPVNSWVWIKYTKEGNSRVLYSSTDGETWTQECTLSNSYDRTAVAALLQNANSLGIEVDLSETYVKQSTEYLWRPYYEVQGKQGTLFLTKPTATTTSTVVSANSSPTATYAGSVVTPVSLGKTVTMDTTLTKILSVDNA